MCTVFFIGRTWLRRGSASCLEQAPNRAGFRGDRETVPQASHQHRTSRQTVLILCVQNVHWIFFVFQVLFCCSFDFSVLDLFSSVFVRHICFPVSDFVLLVLVYSTTLFSSSFQCLIIVFLFSSFLTILVLAKSSRLTCHQLSFQRALQTYSFVRSKVW